MCKLKLSTRILRPNVVPIRSNSGLAFLAFSLSSPFHDVILSFAVTIDVAQLTSASMIPRRWLNSWSRTCCANVFRSPFHIRRSTELRALSALIEVITPKSKGVLIYGNVALTLHHLKFLGQDIGHGQRHCVLSSHYYVLSFVHRSLSSQLTIMGHGRVICSREPNPFLARSCKP